ncbi:MAG: hypothetical protein AAF616_15805 [Bacteroidota bacterium]
MKKAIDVTTMLLLILVSKYTFSQTSQPKVSTIEFGPCIEFIGGYFVDPETAQKLVPNKYALDVSDQGTVTAQVRAINCESIRITYEDGTVKEGGMHILYQLGAAIKPPVKLEPHPYLKEGKKVTEYHAYAYNTLTNYEPLAEALTLSGISGVHFTDALTLNTGDNDPNSCDLVPVYGSIASPENLALSFSGKVRDLGLQDEDSCEFGANDITTSERAVWYTDGAFGLAISDTAVPNSQILLYNADPNTYQPYPVAYSPTGKSMKLIGGDDIKQFSFTMSGLLERGEVFTMLRPVHEKE